LHPPVYFKLDENETIKQDSQQSILRKRKLKRLKMLSKWL